MLVPDGAMNATPLWNTDFQKVVSRNHKLTQRGFLVIGSPREEPSLADFVVSRDYFWKSVFQRCAAFMASSSTAYMVCLM